MSEEDENPVTLHSVDVRLAKVEVNVKWLKRLMVPNFIVTLITLLVAILGVIVRLV